MNAPMYHYDTTDELEDPLPGRDLPPKSHRTDAEIRQHCAELRAILAEAKDRRPKEKP